MRGSITLFAGTTHPVLIELSDRLEWSCEDEIILFYLNVRFPAEEYNMPSMGVPSYGMLANANEYYNSIGILSELVIKETVDSLPPDAEP